MRVHSKAERWFDVVNYTVLATLAFVCFYPFVMMTVLSINAGTDSMRGGITLWPRVFTLVNYRVILENAAIQRAYVVTVMRTAIGTAGGVFVTALVAYGLAERRLPGRKYIMVYMVIPMFFSGGLIPYFLQLRDLRLINTFWVYVIPAGFSVWTMIVMKTSFQGLPDGLTEAARMDGAGYPTIFFRIVVPLSIPMFAVLGLFSAVTHWNDYFTGEFFVNTEPRLWPLQTFLRVSRQNAIDILKGVILDYSNMSPLEEEASRLTQRSLDMAFTVFAMVPILLVYPWLQRYFVKGVLIGSIKE
jgi:putative aldouronate transport system permease protein